MSDPMPYCRQDLVWFRELVSKYNLLSDETRCRVSFRQYCEWREDMDAAEERARQWKAREYLLQAAQADIHSSDVEPLVDIPGTN